jgi:ankyrin repeat protein
LAAINGHPEVVTLLLDKGADLYARNHAGKLAF